jgi:DNA invertase Pin-like site-specific DNA recombinase
MMNMTTYGYCRISAADQCESRQLAAMRELQILPENIFIDKQSGKDFERDGYKALVKKLTKGDLLYVLSLDRFGRNYNELLHEWKYITKDIEADIMVIDMPILNTRLHKDLIGTFISDIVLQILSFVSENERTNIRSRQAQGIAAARARGVHLGRPIKKPPENFAKVVKQWERGKLHISEVLEQTGLKQATFYNRLREYRRAKKR